MIIQQMLSDASITHGECVHGKFPFLWWQTFEQSFMNHVAYEIGIFEDKSKIIVEHFRNKVQCVHEKFHSQYMKRFPFNGYFTWREKELNFTDDEQIQATLLLRLAFSKTNQAKTRSSSLPCIFAKSRLLEPAQSAIKQELPKLIKLKNSAPLSW